MNNPFRKCTIISTQLLIVCLLASPAASAEPFIPVPNAEFNEGNNVPTAWTLSGGNGRWIDGQALEVTGDGTDSNFWRCDYHFAPGQLYRFGVRGRGTPSQGSGVVGPVFANHDVHTPSSDWKWLSYVFRVPDNVTDSYFRVGQWQTNASLQFDAVTLAPVIAAHLAVGNLLLGDGESLHDGHYTFSATYGHEGSNYHRPLQSTTTGFNSNRWTFSNGSHVTYRFQLPGSKFISGQISFNVNHHTNGRCVAEVSRDEKTWHTLVTQEKVGSAQAELPDELLPSDTLFLRFRSVGKESSFQIDQIEFDARLDENLTDATGKTIFASIDQRRPGLEIERITIEQPDVGRTTLNVTVKNTSRRDCNGEVGVHMTPHATTRKGQPRDKTRFKLARNQSSVIPILIPTDQPGSHSMELRIGDSQADGPLVHATFPFTVPDYYRTDYGQQIAIGSGKARIWWCDATHKIPRSRAVPVAQGSAARMSAARHDYEAVQIVVHADEAVQGLTATASPLSGPNKATIPPENVQILRVHHHFVHHPTDKTGIRDFWPDALPPLTTPIDLPAGVNQPLWVLVHVPKDAQAGDYTGTISLTAKNFSAQVPLKLHVWDFTLPDRNHIETAFGFSAGNVYRYHQLKTEQDKRVVLDKYFRSFAEHRISPYDPVPLDPIRVTFLPDADPPRADVDFSAFDRAFGRAVEEFHFTGIRLPIQGMGGGTYHARSEPRIGKFGEDTPQYQAMFASYVKQLENHLREKGWLKYAYIYWFDEPAPRDYPFVAAGMRRLKNNAPGLQRMLTEEPADNVLANLVNIWCPVSYNYNHQEAEKRRADGDRFWWYVCCGPKEPFCTLFIDHPATELRTWLWQTWQRDIAGTLVWSSNYWTSDAAYPDKPQNPYEDPMGYVSGYSTPAGTKRFWGNGDGRFIYPPESAAVPGKLGSNPILEPPVSSIRWEMLREGIEDYEYLYLLRQLLTERRGKLKPEEVELYEELLNVPEEITRDMTTFTTDPKPIYARRAKIAEAIERLQK